MSEEVQYELPLQIEEAVVAASSPAQDKWLAELGGQLNSLSDMIRKPTEVRPFIYELRIDLLPAGKRDMLLIAKGFGADDALVAFHNGVGFLTVLRGFEGQLRAGKVRWYVDSYPPNTYEERKASYMKGDYYRL